MQAQCCSHARACVHVLPHPPFSLQLEKRLQGSEATVQALQQTRAALSAQLERLKLDSEYLRVRATEVRNKKPRLAYTAALSLTVAPAKS